ncbi:hypothetical protein [Rhizobium sp. CSW-27]|uniref:hypothetical protein n=1 Tax=Rhizobium sp. CSW-27 TaxID=2839985 RepID=UPI001C019051|nr:hypothetical protein [Rhizobium sp. CSW-27]MBT9372897.1 hypothetical protein [Rhizobium sp. CSW-27]
MDGHDILPDRLARAFWNRSASEAEGVAMRGEIERDAPAIGAHSLGRDNALFSVEPAHFAALMLREACRER